MATTNTFTTLTTEETEAEIFAALVQDLIDAGIPDSYYAPGSGMTNIIMAFVQRYKAFSDQRRAIASGSVLRTSFGEYLQMIAPEYNVTPQVATPNKGYFVVSGVAGGTTSITSKGQVTVNDFGTNNWTNDSPFTVASGSTVSVLFVATEPGSSHNIANYTPLQFTPDITNLAVSCPPYLSSSTWITEAGLDAEEDEHLKERCRLQYALFGVGGDTQSRLSAMLYNAFPDIQKIAIDALNPRGENTADIYVSGLTTLVPATVITSSNALITSSLLFGTSGSNPYRVLDANTIETNISGTVYCTFDSNVNTVQSNVETSLNNFHKIWPLGGKILSGSARGVARAKVMKAITDVVDVEFVELAAPSHNIYQEKQDLLVPGTYIGLTYVNLTE